MFVKCRFNQPVHLWDMSKAISINGMFNGCVSFNNGFLPGVPNQLPWNTSECNSMSGVFQGCTAFNSNLGTGTIPWDVSKVKYILNTLNGFSNMFQGASNFNNGDEDDVTKSKINSWNIGGNVTGIIDMTSMFNGASRFNRDISGWDVSKVTSFTSMFESAIAFTNGLNENTNFITSGTGINGWNINTTTAVSMANMFKNASAFNREVSSWNVSKVNNMSSMFQGTPFNKTLANWERVLSPDTSTLANVTTTANMFLLAQLFNQPIGNWNVSGVTSMSGMFSAARIFNQDISKWNVGKVTTFLYMFYGNPTTMSFNNGDNLDYNSVTNLQGIDGWNINTSPTASVTMEGMFIGTNQQHPFNRPIESWNVSRVTNMGNMFNSCSFNQPLANWERVSSGVTSTLSNVSSMAGMFFQTNSFNQPIGNWNVSGVTSMEGMFDGASKFNNGLLSGVTGTLSWNTSSATNIWKMFRNARAFNQNINSWNVSKVKLFQQMFEGATIFNQPLNLWNTSSATQMQQMFYLAPAFRQYIGSWDVSKVINLTNFMLDKTPTTFPSTYLDNIYSGWSTQTLQHTTPITITFGTAQYTSAGLPGRNTLTSSPNNWIISDGGNADPILNLDAGNPLSYSGTGTLWTDLSVYGNNGTLVNNPTFDSANGGSIVFDGVNQYMTTLLNSSANNTTSIIWYKWNGVNKATSLTYLGISSSTGLGFYINNGTNTNTAGNKISVLYGGAYYNALTTGTLFGTLVSGVYTQLTLTRDGSSTYLYQNGVFLGATTRTPNNSTSNLSFNLGTDVIVGFPPFGGAVPLIQFYNRALTSTEVLANYNATKGRFGL
jgi:surface protein